MNIRSLMVVALVSVALSGCSALSKFRISDASEVCLLSNRQLGSSELLSAVEAGLNAQSKNAKVKVIQDEEKMKDCSLCVIYGISAKAGKLSSIDFHMVRDGTVVFSASGPASEAGELTLEKAALYAAEFMARFNQNLSGPKSSDSKD